MKPRRPWVDASTRPAPVCWFDLADARTGRVLGSFLYLADARGYLVRRPPTARYVLRLRLNGRVTAAWRCRSAFGGRVVGLEELGRVLSDAKGLENRRWDDGEGA